MAKRPTKQPRGRSLMQRLTRGPTLLAAVIAGAVAVVAVVIVVSVVTQGDGGIDAVERPTDVNLEGRIRGDPDAPVTIIEFADYQCGHCANYSLTTAREIDEEYVANGLVRAEFWNMAFMGTESVWAAMGAECASEQGKFWEYHDMLFEKQRGVDNGAFSNERLKRFAGDLELDQETFDECLDSGQYAQTVLDETDGGRALDVSSTPTLFIKITGSDDYEKVVGHKPFSELQAIIEEKLEEAGRSS